MAQSKPVAAVTELYLFPYYPNQEEYKQATGKEAPTYLPYKPRKYWLDPDAATSPKRYQTYDRALVTKDNGFTPMVGEDGRPVVDQLILLKEDAAALNIPPTKTYAPGELPPATPEVQCPQRALQPGEELAFDFAGNVIVKNQDLLDQMNGGFTNSDRRMLQAIAAKLGL
jgi:hypothetical protein